MRDKNRSPLLRYGIEASSPHHAARRGYYTQLFAVYHQPKGPDIIKPQKDSFYTRFARCHTRLCRNYIQRASALMPYQACGLDKKFDKSKLVEFFWPTR